MLKKSIIINLAFAILLLPFCSAGASEKGNCNLESFAAVSQSSLKILDLFSNNDEALSRIIDTMYEKNLIAMPPQEFKLTMLDYIQELTTSQQIDIAPGCLPPYAIAAVTLLTFVPTTFVLYVDELTNGESECSLMYGSWCILGVSSALASWTTYRICAEQNAETPNQDTITKLQSDLAVMRSAAFVSLAFGAAYSTECDDTIYDTFFND